MLCWEFKKCGRDKTRDCSAYPSNGENCWLSAGTLCDGKVQGTYAQKLGDCTKCDFYKVMKEDYLRHRELELGKY